MNNLGKHNKIRLKIMTSGIIASLFSLFQKKDADLIIFNSFFNLQFNSNTKHFFLFLLQQKDILGITIKYVINNDLLRKKLQTLYGDYFIETNSFKGKIFALKAKTWLLNSYELPVGGIFLNRGRNIVCLSHGSPIKNEGTLEKDVGFIKRIYYRILHTNISYMLATASAFANVYSKYLNLPMRKILISGLPQFDQLSVVPKNVDFFDSMAFNILYAPTWRHYGNPSLFDFDDFDIFDFSKFLKTNNIKIWLRLHPNFEDSVISGFSNIENIKEFSGKKFPDIMEYLSLFDGLITDYSSICLDYLPLNRPMFFMTSDYEMYDKEIGFCVDYNHWTPGYKPHTYKDFKISILDAIGKDSFKRQREAVMHEYSCRIDGNCANLLDLLINEGIVNTVNGKEGEN